MPIKVIQKDARNTRERASKKKELEEILLMQVMNEIDQAETYLEAEIRPRIADNWKYYKRELPSVLPGEASFVDNTCQATVDHCVAVCMDAFNSGDSLEVVPEGVTNPITLKVINQIMNDILDTENNRHTLYQAFFRDTLVSSASVLKPYVTYVPVAEREYFTKVEQGSIDMRVAELEEKFSTEKGKVLIKIIIEDSEIVEEVIAQNFDENSILGAMEIESAELVFSTELLSGFIEIIREEKTIKIDHIRGENFIIDTDATCIDDARVCGHKSLVTISELLKMGFDEEKVQFIYDTCTEDSDVNFNIASMARDEALLLDPGSYDGSDPSQEQVELYELYMHTSGKSFTDKVAEAHLYKILYVSNVILEFERVDSHPYVGGSAIELPHQFWGEGLVDRTKHIQRANSGVMRQLFTYNELATKPRFLFKPSGLVNPRDIQNNKPGAGIAVKEGVSLADAISPVQLSVLQGDQAGIMQLLATQRENGTGVTYTGQSLAGDALKAGASTQSAAMIMSDSQKLNKLTVETLFNNTIRPLLETVYELLRTNFSKWDVIVEGEELPVNPNQWPRLREVQFKTPLGTNAKLEQSQKYSALVQQLVTAQPGTEMAKLATAQNIRKAMIKSYELMDVADAAFYLPSEQEIAQKDQMNQQMQQLSQQMQQMQQQLQQLTQENSVLKNTASQLTAQELELRNREVRVKEGQLDVNRDKVHSEIEYKVDETIRKDEFNTAQIENMADDQGLKELIEERRQMMVEAEISTGENLFKGF